MNKITIKKYKGMWYAVCKDKSHSHYEKAVWPEKNHQAALKAVLDHLEINGIFW